MAVLTSTPGQVQERVSLWPAVVRFTQRLVAESAVASITLGAAFLLSSLLIIATNTNPFDVIRAHGLSIETLGRLLHYPFNAYVALFSGSFGAPDLATTSLTISQAVPLVFTGMAVAFAFRGGLFNIGAEGQLYAGAIFATWLGISFSSLPAVLLLPIVLVASILAGAVWGAIAGFLKAYRGAHEVITTIMLNWIAIYGTTALVETDGPLNSPIAQGQAESPHIGTGGYLPNLSWLGKDASLDAGVYLALLGVVLFWFVIWRTSLGYEIRAVGLNAGAAAYGGIPVKRRMVLTMAIAGGLGGLAGGIHIADPTNTGVFQSNFSPGWGFDGIAVALLGKGNPVGIILSAILFGALRTGSQAMQIAGVSPHITELLQGIIVLFIALDVVVRKLLSRRGSLAAMGDEKAGTGTAYTPSVEVVAAPGSGGESTAWRGLGILALVVASCSLLFSHLAFGIVAFVFCALFVTAQRRLSSSALALVIYTAICLVLGLAVNQYL